jgi:MATE family multidrug resistance protein
MKFYKTYIKEFLKLSLPVLLGQIGSVLMALTDMIMLGNVGKLEVAAVGIANQVYFLVTVFGMGALATLSPLVATSKSANRSRECGELLRTGIELSFILGMVLFIILFILSENFEIFNQPPEINFIARKYLRMLSISTFPFLLFITLKQFSDGLSLTKPAMYITLIAVLLNIILNSIFIYGLFSFPGAGAFGAGIATLFARCFMAASLVLYIFKTDSYIEFLPHLVSRFKTGPVIIKMLRVGIPSGMQMFFEISAFTCTAVLVGWLGTSYLAAHQILLGILALMYTSAVGFSVAGSIKVANAVGETNYSSLQLWSKFTFFTVLVILSLSGLLLFFINKPLLLLFINENEVISIASSAFILMAFFIVVDGLQITGIGLLRSIEDVKIPTVITLSSYILIGLPISYVCAFPYNLRLQGIWIGLIAGGLLSSIILNCRYFMLISTINFNKYKEIELNQ